MQRKVQTSSAAKRLLDRLHAPAESLQRMVFHHEREAIQRRLPTPDGPLDVMMSFHPIFLPHGREVMALVRRENGSKFVLYTEAEFKDILKESLRFKTPTGPLVTLPSSA